MDSTLPSGHAPGPKRPPASRLTPLARAVRARREALGLRQSEVADLAGCSERFVHTLEHAKPSLRLDKVLDVLEVLGLDLLVAPGRGRVEGAPPGEPDGREDA
jgi:y4mF family transcriptional regulator